MQVLCVAEFDPELDVRLVPCCSVNPIHSRTLHQKALRTILYTGPIIKVVAERIEDLRE